MYGLAPITLLALRKAAPHRPRPYRLPADPVLAPLAFVAANKIICWTSWDTAQKLMLAIVAGYLVFGIAYELGHPMERPPLDPLSVVWILPWLGGLAVISYLGQYGGMKLIPEWIDMGVVVAFSLVVCYAAVQLPLSSHRVAATIATDERVAAAQPELRTA